MNDNYGFIFDFFELVTLFYLVGIVFNGLDGICWCWFGLVGGY